MKRISIFLTMIALIAGMAGCGGNSGGGNGGESYTLTVDSTAGGAVAVNNVTIPGKAIFTYDAGTVVSLNATPDSGYQFVRWTGDVDTVDNVHASETIITVNGNYSIMANFEVPPPVQYSLTIFSTAGGSVTTPGEGRFTYDEETMVNLVAKPASGYKFAKWTGDVDTIANVNAASTNITMSGNCYIAANFREAPIVCTSFGYHTVGLKSDGTVVAVGNNSDGQYNVAGWTDITGAEAGYLHMVGLKWDGSVVALGCNCSPSSNQTTPSNPKEPPWGYCFIATAAYGTPMAEEIQILREFRDKYLLTNPLGRAFVDFYYKVSPPIAQFITNHPSLKPIVRAGLAPVVSVSTVVVNTTMIEKIAILGLLVLVSVSVAIWVIRRRGRGLEDS